MSRPIVARAGGSRARPRPVWAVVPAKSLDRGKSRLSPVLDDAERARFAGELLEHVLAVLGRSGLDGVLVATDGDDVAALARAHGAHVLLDAGTGRARAGGRTRPHRSAGQDTPRLAAVVDEALAEVQARGAAAALVFMADLPRIEVSDVHQLAAALDDRAVVLVRDHLGPHTNALGLALPTRMPTCFGRPDSFDAHCAAARAAGLDVVVVDSPRVAFDVDAPADHAALGRNR